MYYRKNIIYYVVICIYMLYNKKLSIGIYLYIKLSI